VAIVFEDMYKIILQAGEEFPISILPKNHPDDIVFITTIRISANDASRLCEVLNNINKGHTISFQCYYGHEYNAGWSSRSECDDFLIVESRGYYEPIIINKGFVPILANKILSMNKKTTTIDSLAGAKRRMDDNLRSMFC